LFPVIRETQAATPSARIRSAGPQSASAITITTVIPYITCQQNGTGHIEQWLLV
jgi:hypothetical protein